MAIYEFSSWGDIEKFVQSKLGYNLGLINGKPLSEILTEEQSRLKRILQEEVKNYYRSYTPSRNSPYQRTMDMLNSITVGKMKIDKQGFLTTSVYFNDKAYKPSIISPKHEDGFTPILIDQGWSWSTENQPDPPIHHFTYRPREKYDFNFSETAVQRYNEENPYGFVVELIIEYKGKSVI